MITDSKSKLQFDKIFATPTNVSTERLNVKKPLFRKSTSFLELMVLINCQSCIYALYE